MKYYDFLPNFLGIGAHRAGTTWLWENLKQHSFIWMPPLKEIHYFDRSPIYPSPSFLYSDKFISRVFGSEPHNAVYRRMFYSQIKNTFYHRNWKRIRWDFNFFGGRYNDNWYASLFKYGKNKIRGEITPAYSMLDPMDVRHIKNLIPDLKIIFIIRDPIDRAWSHVRYDEELGFLKGAGSLSILKEFINSPTQILRGDYIRTINIWHSYFSADKIFIGFFDEISSNPNNLLLKIFDFLGVEAPEARMTQKLSEKINVSPVKEIPDELRRYLAEKYYKQVKHLSNMLGSYATIWLKNIESYTFCQ